MYEVKTFTLNAHQSAPTRGISLLQLNSILYEVCTKCMHFFKVGTAMYLEEIRTAKLAVY